MLLKDLTTLTASLASGTLFHVEKSGKAYNIDYTKLAKAIVEEYNGSTLGGSAQTVQAAIAALNSSLIVPNNRITIPNNSDINTYTTPGVYAVVSDASASTMTNMPRAASGKLIVLTRGNNIVYIQQRYITTSSSPNEYIRNYNNGSFTSWELVPRQSDILEKNYVFTGINASSTNNLQQLGMIDVYGAMLAVFRVDGALDGTSVYVVRRNSAGWQISTLYEGEASNTPVVDSNGILKLKSSSTGSAIHALGIVFAKWT